MLATATAAFTDARVASSFRPPSTKAALSKRQTRRPGDDSQKRGKSSSPIPRRRAGQRECCVGPAPRVAPEASFSSAKQFPLDAEINLQNARALAQGQGCGRRRNGPFTDIGRNESVSGLPTAGARDLHSLHCPVALRRNIRMPKSLSNARNRRCSARVWAGQRSDS